MEKKIEKITKTITEEVISYVAIDGTKFTTEEECRTYDGTCRAMLMARFRQIPKRITSAYWSGLTSGNEDNTIIFLKLDKEVKDLILQLVKAYEGYVHPKFEARLMGYKDGTEVALEVAIYTDKQIPYFDFFSIVGTKEEVIKAIEDQWESMQYQEGRLKSCEHSVDEEGHDHYSEFTYIEMTFLGLKK